MPIWQSLRRFFKKNVDAPGDSLFSPLIDFIKSLLDFFGNMPWWLQLLVFVILLLLAAVVIFVIYDSAMIQNRNERRLKTLRKRRDMRRTHREERKRSLEDGYRDLHGLLRIRKSSG